MQSIDLIRDNLKRSEEAVLALSGWLSRLEELPHEVLLFTGAVNVLYASYSFPLAVRPVRPMRLINLLVFANLAWVPVCLGLVAAFSESVTLFGVVHLIGEAIFVGGLAILEWRNRDLLLTAVEPAAAGRQHA